MLDKLATDVGRNNNERRIKQQPTSNAMGTKWMVTDVDSTGNNAVEQSTSVSSKVMACRREKRFFFSISCFLKIIFFFFFFFFF
jgi:hypothetical protein